MLTFPSAPNHVRTRRKTSVSSKSQPSSSEAKTRLKLTFLKSPKSSTHAFSAWCHSHPPVIFLSRIFILTSLNDTWTPALMLHLTNPCTKRKVLSLTKPKGKIYKTKSLGHYITFGQLVYVWKLEEVNLYNRLRSKPEFWAKYLEADICLIDLYDNMSAFQLSTADTLQSVRFFSTFFFYWHYKYRERTINT